jgi:histidyl-tRNA synthetase
VMGDQRDEGEQERRAGPGEPAAAAVRGHGGEQAGGPAENRRHADIGDGSRQIGEPPLGGGVRFGIERLLPLMPESNLPVVEKTQALIIPVNTQNMSYALRVAKIAREVGLRVEVDVTEHGVGAGLKLATKKETPWALIVGEDEQQTNRVTLHHLGTGEELVVDIHSLAHQILGEEQPV